MYPVAGSTLINTIFVLNLEPVSVYAVSLPPLRAARDTETRSCQLESLSVFSIRRYSPCRRARRSIPAARSCQLESVSVFSIQRYSEYEYTGTQYGRPAAAARLLVQPPLSGAVAPGLYRSAYVNLARRPLPPGRRRAPRGAAEADF